jgi:PKD repeat protein
MFRVNNKCQGLPVTFQNQTVVPNGALTYEWDFGDGSPKSTAVNPSHLYTVPDGYKVTLKATANGCVSILVKNAYLFARPVANFGAPLAPICAKSEVFMPNSSTIANGSQGAYWTFGDGSSSTQFDGQHAYTGAGTYTVKLLAVSEFDCKDSITKSVTIKPTPNPDFTGNQFCAKIPTIFTNKTSEALPNPVYNWTFSDNFTSTLKNVTRTWPYEGPFSVLLKASYSNGCSASITKEFTVLMQPKADFSVQPICSGETANFVNNTKGDRSGIEYNWDFGNSTTSTLLAPTRLYNPSATTTYTVTLVASYPAGCSDTVRKTITVSESPVCDFTFKDLGLKNVRFTPGNATYTKYEWFFGEGGTSTSTAPTYLYAYTGNFNVTMRATNLAGCTCELTKKVSATTGINLLSNVNGVSVYPNPNNGTFTVTNADNKAMKVEIFNVLGTKILSKSSVEGTMLLNLEDHAKGIYLVKVTIDGVTTTTKITVTN